MANTNAPFGFVPFTSLSGAAPTYGQVTRLANYNAAAIYTGDPVTQAADGTITIATAGVNPINGIFVGCEYVSVSRQQLVSNSYWPGSDVAVGQFVTCFLIVDPGAAFLVQTGGSTTLPTAFADIGNLVNFGIGTPTAATGRSGAFANITTLAPATATLPFKILSLVQTPPGANGTDITTAYNQIVVGFNFVDSRSMTGI